MMRRAMMYLRPGNLYKEFVIEDNKADIGKTGRATASFSGDGSRTLKGALAEATPKQKVEWQQLQHPISHTIIQDGRPKAKAEDKDSRESEIERTITDALLVHPATEYVRNFIFDYSSGDAVVSFIVKGAQWEEEETISTVFEKGVS